MKRPGRLFSGIALGILALGFAILYFFAEPLYAFVFAFLYCAAFVLGIYIGKWIVSMRKDLRNRRRTRA